MAKNNWFNQRSDVFTAVQNTQKAKNNNPLWQCYKSIYFQYLCRIIYNIYMWENLPDTMDARFLEMSLMNDGVAGLYEHPMYGHINTRATWGELGIYGLPVYSTFYTYNDTLEERVDVSKDSKNAVLVLNNSMGAPITPTAVAYAERCASAIIAHMLNMDAQKTPVGFAGDYTQLEQLQKAYMQYAGGSPVIPRRTNSKKDELNTLNNPIQVLNTAVPFVADSIHSELINIIHDFFALVGINYANNQKKFQMLSDEVNANNQEILTSALSGLKARVDAADQYNKIHGTNIVVHLSVNPLTAEPLDDNSHVGGGQDTEPTPIYQSEEVVTK